MVLLQVGSWIKVMMDAIWVDGRAVFATARGCRKVGQQEPVLGVSYAEEKGGRWWQ